MAARGPGAGRGGARGTVPRQVCVATSRSGSEMASPPSSRKSSAQSRKTSSISSNWASTGRSGSLLSGSRRVSGESRKGPTVSGSSYRPRKVPWATLVRALGRFKLFLPEIRRDQLLAAYDPLALDEVPQPWAEQDTTSQKTFWGDHQQLSKALHLSRPQPPPRAPPGYPSLHLHPSPRETSLNPSSPRSRPPVLPQLIPFKTLHGHEQAVSSCHFCVDDTKLLSGSYDCTVKLWDALDGSVIRDFQQRPSAPVLECSVTADSRRIVASSYDKSVRAWDVETGKLLWKVRHNTFIVSCKFSPDGKYVALALDLDRALCIMDSKDVRSVIRVKDHHRKSIMACSFDPDSQKVASVSLDGSIKIWDVTSQATLLSIKKAHANAISNCCFTFSGHFLCTSSWDKTLKIWNIHSGELRNRGACVTLVQGHAGSVSTCHVSRDSSLLISGGLDKTVAIWDVGEGYRKLSLKGHDDWVTDVAISNNKKWILSASKDKTMRLWNIEEIDQIPLVKENKKARGFKVKQCKGCDRPFSIHEGDDPSEVTKCVFCRTDERNQQAEASSSGEESKDA
uniref:WD repeat-containing protein 88 n=1 Tax=Castor canadensis TaxID=51338 RepID=A0A8B7VYJ9_CASCN|nr:WD repeat-containing protein 88 [Castor canadensis]